MEGLHCIASEKLKQPTKNKRRYGWIDGLMDWVGVCELHPFFSPKYWQIVLAHYEEFPDAYRWVGAFFESIRFSWILTGRVVLRRRLLHLRVQFQGMHLFRRVMTKYWPNQWCLESKNPKVLGFGTLSLNEGWAECEHFFHTLYINIYYIYMSMYIQVDRGAVYADIAGCIPVPAVPVTYWFVARLPDYHCVPMFTGYWTYL